MTVVELSLRKNLKRIINSPYFLPGFILIWTVVNLLQAGLTELSGDEAYYFMYTKDLDWGFKDHPPLVGLFVKFGYTLFQSPLGVRLTSVLVNSFLIWMIWISSDRKAPAWLLALLVITVPAFQIYGFIATPDVPLLLFTALFLLVYRKFLEVENWSNTLLLGLMMTLLLWSKYHGVLIIGFTILSNLRLLLNAKFWTAGILALLLFIPHLYWQYQHDFITFKYHLFERTGGFEWRLFLDFIAGQFGIWNPIVLVGGMIAVFSMRDLEPFEKTLKWMFIGFLGFFFLSSLRGKVEAHWTAAAAIPFFILVLRNIEKTPNFKKWIVRSAIPILVMVCIARMALIVDFIPFLKEFHHNKANAKALSVLADGKPIVFSNTYQQPSLYTFYTGGLAHDLNNVYYGKYSYDIWRYDEKINRKPFLYVKRDGVEGFEVFDMPNGVQVHYREMENFPFYQKLYARSDVKSLSGRSGDRMSFAVNLVNDHSYPVDFKDPENKLEFLGYMNFKQDDEAIFHMDVDTLPSSIPAFSSWQCTFSFVMPEGVGEKRMKLALKTRDLAPTYCGDWIEMELLK